MVVVVVVHSSLLQVPSQQNLLFLQVEPPHMAISSFWVPSVFPMHITSQLLCWFIKQLPAQSSQGSLIQLHVTSGTNFCRYEAVAVFVAMGKELMMMMIWYFIFC
jgi:hypothetical protein